MVKRLFTTNAHNILQATAIWGVQSRLVGIAGSLRVSLRYDFFPLPGQEGGQWMVERDFQRPAGSQVSQRYLQVDS